MSGAPATPALEAERGYREALARDPGDVVALANFGLWLEKEGRYAEAEACQRAALQLLPDNAKLHANLANLLARTGRAAQAESHHRSALQLDPRSAIAWSNLGAFLASGGREEEAEACLRRALDLKPDYARARVNLAYLLLGQGRMREGWLQHEARYAPDLEERGSLVPRLPFPRWRGEDLAGRSLLVWPEQGLGDEIQFCRYATLLRRRGAARITWVCRRPLQRLLSTHADIDEVVSAEEAMAGVARHDYWSFPLSLPLHCATLHASVPASVPYLRAGAADPDLPPLPPGELRVGLVWRGNPANPQDAWRSLPGLSAFEALWSLRGASCVGLQHGEAASWPGAPLASWGERMTDFADAAAMLSRLDLLISVDTAIAHLAGALGKPCWLLLPARMSDWRWQKAGETSAWYPRHRLFRQEEGSGWTGVISRLRSALRQRLAR